MQTVGAGLTCFTLIKIAITTYSDFPWNEVAQILNPEFGNWLAAAAAINDDPYYGFKSDLGAAKSTLYKNLAWVAAQLLIRVGRMYTLQQYMGIPAIVKDQGKLTTIISDYIRHRNEGEVIPVDINEGVVDRCYTG